MSGARALEVIKQNSIEFVDLRFVDSIGKEHHVTVPAHTVDKEFMQHGKMIDGSSIMGWKDIHESDMALVPDFDTIFVDPFVEVPTLVLRCDVFEPNSTVPYNRCPRSIAKAAEAHLKKTGIADTCYMGPEPEFFIFDSVLWKTKINGAMFEVDSEEGAWNSDRKYEEGNMGHRPNIKGGYFPVAPVDSGQDIRTAMCQILESLGIPVEAHHHEVGTAAQNEISTRFNSLLKKADELMTFKYVVKNVAHAWGKTATFMPKPLLGDNGSGMHVHQSLSLKGDNIFAGEGYAHLSDVALYYIGGIIHHARALNAFTNPGTNSYKRLVPGFEAPVMLSYSSCNRSAAIRVPHTTNAKGRRIEVRFPDPSSNPYLGFSAMMMAGLDGIQKRIHPGDALEKNLYELSEDAAKKIPTVCSSLEQAMESLCADREFLKAGHVFTDDAIDNYIKLKLTDIDRLRMAPHPIEFEMYYSL
jgi:glutamine synthetase